MIRGLPHASAILSSHHSRCLAAIPIQFAEERGWGPVTSELPFLALLLGTILGGAANVLFVPLPIPFPSTPFNSHQQQQILHPQTPSKQHARCPRSSPPPDDDWLDLLRRRPLHLRLDILPPRILARTMYRTRMHGIRLLYYFPSSAKLLD